MNKANRNSFDMRKTVKISLIVLSVLVAIVFVNGCYFVFSGQEKAMQKIRQGDRLNLYENCSAYTMHMALWIFGWPLSPEAARECFLLHFPHHEDEVVTFSASKRFIKAPKLLAAINSLADKPTGSTVHVTWNASRDYALNSPERRAAIAVNACDVTKGRIVESDSENAANGFEVRISCAMIYPKYSWTRFNLGKFSIYIHEGLFRYLQDNGWLSKYMAVYVVDEFRTSGECLSEKHPAQVP